MWWRLLREIELLWLLCVKGRGLLLHSRILSGGLAVIELRGLRLGEVLRLGVVALRRLGYSPLALGLTIVIGVVVH